MTDPSRSQDATPLAHTVPKAARRLGIGRTSVFDMIRRGQLRSFTLAGRRLIPESELYRLVSERLAVAQAERAA